MSRAYRIQVSESLNKIIRAEDHVKTELELLNILPTDQMGELLAGELEKEGYEKDGTTLTKVDGNITISVDTESGEVTVTASDCEEIDLEGKKSGSYYNDAGDGRKKTTEKLRDQLQQELEDKGDAKEEKLQQSITNELERQLADVRTELDRAVNRTTAEALKQKAAQIGQIKEMTEDPEAGSLTIVVEV